MAEVSVRVNGHIYAVGCEDGQEQHVVALAKMFDQHVTQVAQEVGQLGETRLFLLGALLLADELADARGRLDDTVGAERLASEALEAAAGRIEALAAKAG